MAQAIKIKSGLEFTRNSACGPYVSRVIRDHRDAGYFETEIVSGGHPALLNSIQVVSSSTISTALRAA